MVWFLVAVNLIRMTMLSVDLVNENLHPHLNLDLGKQSKIEIWLLATIDCTFKAIQYENHNWKTPYKMLILKVKLWENLQQVGHGVR